MGVKALVEKNGLVPVRGRGGSGKRRPGASEVVKGAGRERWEWREWGEKEGPRVEASMERRASVGVEASSGEKGLVPERTSRKRDEKALVPRSKRCRWRQCSGQDKEV